MPYSTLVDVATLARHLANPDWAVVDCRFALAGPDQGEHDYLTAHIPGAVYAHLNRDLSAPHVPGHTGRHPLPAPDDLAATFGRLGISPGVQVVAYDDAGGALAASRLWWLLGWLGHDAAAVLDGGWSAWRAAGLAVETGTATRPARAFGPHQPHAQWLAEAEAVTQVLADPAGRLLDARGADRFRGENETLDPVAGHIPGALSAPYAANLGPDGRLRPAEQLRAHYAEVLGDTPGADAIVYCGSGVTAAHDILAMRHAGLGQARLYAGSWSEWITDPTRPVSR
jgi:thiosulfate/3-mercaptopyruvate sulfurtransferase